MRSLKLTIAYDGTDYVGWQIQPDQPTVQGNLQQAWHQITGEVVNLSASGRTDAGVHALGQVAGVRTGCSLTPQQLQRGLNAQLPADISVLDVEPAADDFHATRDAIRKRYRYQLDNGQYADVFLRRFAWHVPQRLDAVLMHEAGQALVGRHDFTSFASAGSPRTSNVRQITQLCVAAHAGRLIHVEVEGDGFLYNMVRAIVGTLVDVGRGLRNPEYVRDVLAARDRGLAGRTAPPHGLALVSVEYGHSATQGA